MERPLGWPANSGFLLPAINAPTLRKTPRTTSAATASQSPSSQRPISFMRASLFPDGCFAAPHRGYPANLAQKLRMRSEEHTSDLQSLMRTSYAVFCLKKKKKNNH